jgi:hypothetical protein
MMKKTLIATATAGLIAAGAMIATTGTASAAGVYFGGPGWSVGIGGPGYGPAWGPHRECRPVLKTVRWWDNWGRPHFKQVVVGRDCRWAHGPQGGWGGPGPNPGWGGPGPNPGWGYHPHP